MNNEKWYMVVRRDNLVEMIGAIGFYEFENTGWHNRKSIRLCSRRYILDSFLIPCFFCLIWYIRLVSWRKSETLVFGLSIVSLIEIPRMISWCWCWNWVMNKDKSIIFFRMSSFFMFLFRKLFYCCVIFVNECLWFREDWYGKYAEIMVKILFYLPLMVMID